MEYKVFGKTGLKVSAIGFGCWPMGGSQYGEIDEGESIKAVHKALDLGINCFDNAPAYGLGYAEEVLGKALGDRRKDVVVVTKLGLFSQEGDYNFIKDSSREFIMKEIEGSLSRLNTDYLDVYLIHWPDDKTPFAESMRALEDLVQQGKVGHIGVSNFSVEQMVECGKTRPVEVEQVGYNLFDRRVEREVLPFCQKENIGVMAYGSLAHGLLTGTFSEDTKLLESDWRSGGMAFGLPLFEGEHFKKNIKIVGELSDIAGSRGKSVAQLAIAWVLNNPSLSIALVGTRKPEEIEDSAAAADWKLSPEELDKIEKIFAAANIEYEYK